MKRIAILFSAALLALVAPLTALAETTYSGTVVSGETVSISAPFGGTISMLRSKQGDQLSTGDIIASIATTKVYASKSGVITGVFGQPGDAVEDVTNRVGAVLYIAPENKYSIAGDIQYAYNNSDNKYVNIGETVYMRSYSSSRSNTATGVITAAEGTGYTVETTSGELLMGETVVIFRDADCAATSRIGRGAVSRTAEVAVNGSGSILFMHVKDGDAVSRGDLLFETVDGTLDGLYATGNDITATMCGIVASVGISVGSTVSKGDTVLTLYPRDQMQVQIEMDEYDLETIHEGDQLQLEFSYDEAKSSAVTGTVALISHISSAADGSDAVYKAYIDFESMDAVRLGMSVVVTVPGLTETDEQETETPDNVDVPGTGMPLPAEQMPDSAQ